MKKSLFAIAALAVAGLGFMGCDETLLNDACNGTCTSDQLCVETVNAAAACYAEDLVKVDADECDNGRQLNTDGTITCAEAQQCGDKTCEVGTYCTTALNKEGVEEQGCATAAVPDCESKGMLAEWQDDMTVLCISADVRTCTDDSGCEDGYICDDTEKVCVEGTREELNEYTYVRIDDLTSPNVACCGKETCSNGCTKDDPGADIDAIALVKADNTVKYATRVAGYANAFLKGGDFYKEGNTMALDQNQVLGRPDSFKTYGGATGNPAEVECHYTNKIISEGEPAASDYTFASLGGEGGYIIVQMDGKIEAGDKLDVLEVGDCKLINKSGNVEGKANKEEVKVQISINAEDGSWKTVIAKAQASNGLISSPITEETFK